MKREGGGREEKEGGREGKERREWGEREMDSH